MMRLRKMLLLFGAAVMLMSPVCKAEDMQFVDADGNTGYYVDVDSLVFEEATLVNARVAVKKAAMNRMFLYTMQFDAGMRTYRTIESQIVQYDTKKVLETKMGSEVVHPYSEMSPMNSIVEYIYEWTAHRKKVQRPDA